MISFGHSSGPIEIPGTFDDYDGTTSYTVVSIAENAFKGKDIHNNLSIPKTIKSIGKDAFAGCYATGILKISYEGNISDWCDIDFANGGANPLSLAYRNNVIGGSQSGTQNIIIMQQGCENITFAGELLFEQLPVDGSVNHDYKLVIPDDVKVIKPYAFYGIWTGWIEIPASVEAIGESAFSGCTSLSTVYISDLAAWCGVDFTNHESNPLHLGGELMLDNEMVTRVDTPEDVTEVKPYAFYGANAIVSVTASEDLKKIGDFAFYGNKMLETANLSSELVKSVGANAFASCERLTSLSLGCNIGTLGEGAFTGCTALTSVEAYNLTPAQIADFEEAVYQNATLTVPAGYKQEYAEAEGWKEFVNVKEGGEIYKVDISWDKEGGKVIYEGDELEGFNATPYKFIEIYIYPAEGYDVEEVTTNGTSKLYSYSETFHSCTIGYITKDTDIIVTFKNNVSGIDEAGAQDVSVRGADGAILVEGLGQDTTVNVYNISGQLVYSGNDSVINTVSGVYVIEISGKVYKTVVR